MLSAQAIVHLHDERIILWHRQPAAECDGLAGSPWLEAVCRQHQANFDLWHIEDEARAPDATDAQMVEVKHRIDSTNQLRNDLAEALDSMLLEWLEPQRLPDPDAPLNSESPGLIVDRLSILALKIYHTREEMERFDASPEHTAFNRDRLAVLDSQRTDLAGCLDVLWRETLAGTRRFKLYRQLKMYNNPTLNPAVYRSRAVRSREE